MTLGPRSAVADCGVVTSSRAVTGMLGRARTCHASGTFLMLPRPALANPPSNSVRTVATRTRCDGSVLTSAAGALDNRFPRTKYHAQIPAATDVIHTVSRRLPFLTVSTQAIFRELTQIWDTEV